MWEVVEEDNTMHVLPQDDLKPHNLTTSCWCKPIKDPRWKKSIPIWIHNSADRRELIEQGKARKQ